MLKNVKTLLAACAVATLLLPSVSQAEEGAFGKIYMQCGLGGMIGSQINDHQISNIVAISTNITWDLGTTASTSYFSSQNTCMNKKAQLVAFINQSYEKLEKQIASGDGKYLDALTKLAKNDTTTASEYKTQLREKFAKVVADKNYNNLTRKQKVEKLFDLTA